MEVTLSPLGKITPYSRNARKIPQEAIAHLPLPLAGRLMRAFDAIVSKAEDPAAKAGFDAAKKTLKILPDTTQKLLLDRLTLFELSCQQVKLIAGSGLVHARESCPRDAPTRPFVCDLHLRGGILRQLRR